MKEESQSNPISKTTSEIESKHIEYKNQLKDKDKNKYKYSKPSQSNQFKNEKTQIYNPNNQARKRLQQRGLQYLAKNSLAIVLLAGGYGCRSELGQSKQFAQIKSIEGVPTNLFVNSLRNFPRIIQQNWNVTVYIVCSRLNSNLIIDEVQKILQQYPSLPIYMCYQKQNNVLDWNGFESVYTNNQTKLKYPAGIGALKQAKLFYGYDDQYTLQAHIRDIVKPNLVYCFGMANYYEKGLDYQMIGLCMEQNLSCVFRCYQPENISTQLSLVCLRQYGEEKPAWTVLQYKNLISMSNKQLADHCYVWMDNFVFNPRILEQKYPQNNSVLKYEFNCRTLRNKKKQTFQCKIAQNTISYAVMRDKSKCVGYMINKDVQQVYFLKTKQDFAHLKSAQISFSPSKASKRSNKKTII